MIICYEGTPGSGKSYDAVRKILDNLKFGRVVYTNIDGLDGQEEKEHIKLYTGLDDYQLSKQLNFISGSEVSRFWEIAKSGSLIVIDEAHKFFNSRDWQTGTNRLFADWCSTHRHHGFDVLLITQNIEKIDSAARGLVEWTYRYKKVNFLGRLVGNSYICYAFQEDASGKPLKKIVRQYNKAIFKCYKSYVSKDMTEQGIQKHTNILFHPVFYAVPILLVAFVVLFLKSGFSKGQIIPGASTAVVKTKSLASGKTSAAFNSSNPALDKVAGLDASTGLIRSEKAMLGNLRLQVVALFRPEGESGWVMYKDVSAPNFVYRATEFEFARLCSCNPFGRLVAGEVLALR